MTVKHVGGLQVGVERDPQQALSRARYPSVIELEAKVRRPLDSVGALAGGLGALFGASGALVSLLGELGRCAPRRSRLGWLPLGGGCGGLAVAVPYVRLVGFALGRGRVRVGVVAVLLGLLRVRGGRQRCFGSLVGFESLAEGGLESRPPSRAGSTVV
jgi:hypothetical protein